MLGCGFTSSSGGAGLLVEGTLPGEPILLKNESRRKSRLKLSDSSLQVFDCPVPAGISGNVA